MISWFDLIKVYFKYYSILYNIRCKCKLLDPIPQNEDKTVFLRFCFFYCTQSLQTKIYCSKYVAFFLSRKALFRDRKQMCIRFKHVYFKIYEFKFGDMFVHFAPISYFCQKHMHSCHNFQNSLDFPKIFLRPLK